MLSFPLSYFFTLRKAMKGFLHMVGLPESSIGGVVLLDVLTICDDETWRTASRVGAYGLLFLREWASPLPVELNCHGIIYVPLIRQLGPVFKLPLKRTKAYRVYWRGFVRGRVERGSYVQGHFGQSHGGDMAYLGYIQQLEENKAEKKSRYLFLLQ